MYISVDLKCPKCKQVLDVFIKKDAIDGVRCGECDELMLRLPAATKTTFRFADKELKR